MVEPNERWWKPERFPKVLPLCFLDFQSQNSFFRMNFLLGKTVHMDGKWGKRNIYQR